MERDPVHEVLVDHVPSGVETDERRAVPVLDAHGLGEMDGALLRQELPGSVPTTTPRGPRWVARTPAQASRSSVRSPGRKGTPSPPPVFTLDDRAPGLLQLPRRGGDASHRLVHLWERVREVQVARVHVHGVDHEPVAARDRERLLEASG